MHYTESIRLATVAAKDGELRLFNAEQACLEASIDKEVYI